MVFGTPVLKWAVYLEGPYLETTQCKWTSKRTQIESIGSIGSIILAYLETPQCTTIKSYMMVFGVS